MLRSAATPNRTEVQPSPEMKQPATRQLLPTPPAPARSRMHLPNPKMQRKSPIGVRLFKA
jgi:hypothetical protein